MTKKRFINDVFDIYDTWFGYMGENEPTELEIREKDYLLVGIAHSQEDAESICEKLNEQNEELISYSNFSLHDLLDKKNKEIEQLKQKLQIYKSDGMETLNDLQKARDNNKKALKNIEKIIEENEQLKQSIDDMGGRLQGLWANYYENRYGIWSQAIEDVAKELGFKIHTIYDDPISDSDSKKERINGVKKLNEIICENKQLKEQNQRLSEQKNIYKQDWKHLCIDKELLDSENEQLRERIKELEKEVDNLSCGEADWLIEEEL